MATSMNDSYSTSPTVDPQTYFTFEGDIRIIVTYNGMRILGKVSSHALGSASRVWAKLINPTVKSTSSHKELIPRNEKYSSRPTKDGDILLVHRPRKRLRVEDDEIQYASKASEIDFANDDGEALLLLLQIAHLQFHKVPKKLSTEKLLQIAILCEKYDTASLVLPWVSRWMRNFVKGHRENDEYLFIPWALKHKETFSDFVFKQLMVMRRVGERVPPPEDQNRDLLHFLPKGLFENMIKVRKDTIIEFAKLNSSLTQEFISVECPRKEIVGRYYECGPGLYEALLTAIEASRVPPERNGVETFDGNIQKISRGLQKWNLNDVPPVHGLECVTKFRDHIAQLVQERVLDKIPSPLLDSHIEHFNFK